MKVLLLLTTLLAGCGTHENYCQARQRLRSEILDQESSGYARPYSITEMVQRDRIMDAAGRCDES